MVNFDDGSIVVSDTIVISDMDGTLIPGSGVVDKHVEKAIKEYISLGGTFTIATGRNVEGVRACAKQLGINSYIVTTNGSSIYDLANEKVVWNVFLPPEHQEAVQFVKKNYEDEVTIILIAHDKINYVVSKEEHADNFGEECQYIADNYPDKCYKVLFISKEDVSCKVYKDLTRDYNDAFEFVYSGPECLEIMAKGISKGGALEQLLECYGKDIKNSFAIGDYYNDLELIKKANVGVAVANAAQDIRDAADLVVGSCNDGGVADLIYKIIGKKES